MQKVLRAKEMNKCLGCFACMTVCSAVGQKNHSIVKSAIKIRTTGGMASSFVAIVCLACAEPACMEVCPSDALVRRDAGGVLVIEDKCIGCRLCESACIMRAVNFDEETRKPIICRHCGICAKYCPHECLMYEEVRL
jgi:Fe-S-cluster-containing dehydrogenase component